MAKNSQDLKYSIIAPLFDLQEPGYFTCISGYSNARFVPFTDAARHVYQQFFAILSSFGLEYYVFAGTLVGYVRNKRVPPWMDDIDIMIFEKDVPLFEEKVVPMMLECGFNCRPVNEQKQPGGGFHLLALQQSGRREDTIRFSADKNISVPWAQCDVFFSRVDKDNVVRNYSSWGLYHKKDIPVEWVMPPQTIEMNGMTFPTFANIESDILQEYGDVVNTLVVQFHHQVFLRATNTPWDIAAEEFERAVKSTVSALPPGVSSEQYAAYGADPAQSFAAPSEASFDEIAMGIVAQNASAVHLTDDDQIYWVMDIKRLFPNLHVTVDISSLPAAKRAAHLRQFIDVVSPQKPTVGERYRKMIEALDSVLGDTTFLPVRNVEDIS